ncbi:MAG: glycosyltransferase family 39 protein [Desulfobaccales bacterium]
MRVANFLANQGRRLRSPAVAASLVLALIWLLALAFRLSDLAARDLWTDEAWVALAALKSSAAAALAAGHSTPPWYLLGVWATARLLGGQEWGLRFLSFAFGVGTLLAIWLLALRLTSRPASLLALAMVAVSPVMVYYSKELKQYSGDAFFAVLVFYLAERLCASQGRRGWAALALTGVLGLGFSHPLIFCLPAAGLILWRELPAARTRLALLGGLWLLAFGAYYFLFFRHDLDPKLIAYWAKDYPDLSGPGRFCLWLGAALYRYFCYFLGKWGVFWGPPLLAAGAYALWRRGGGRALAYWGLPILLALLAAALHRYPFMGDYGGNRLMLFSAPLLYLVLAAGACLALSYLWRGWRRGLAAGLTAALIISLNPLKNFRENLHPTMNREDISPLVTRLQQEMQPRDEVYVYYFAQWPFAYYYRGQAARLCIGKSCYQTGLKPESRGRAPKRLWLIASHIINVQDMRKFAAKLLGPAWRESTCEQAPGAVLFCFRSAEETRVAAIRRQAAPGPPLVAAATPSSAGVYSK